MARKSANRLTGPGVHAKRLRHCRRSAGSSHRVDLAAAYGLGDLQQSTAPPRPDAKSDVTARPLRIRLVARFSRPPNRPQ